MPQLDIVPYSSEIIWLVITFFVFYFILVKKALPRLYRVLSFRKKKIFFVSTYVTTSLKEKLNYSFLSKGSMGLMITNLKGYISNVSVNVPNYLVQVSSKSYLRSALGSDWSFFRGSVFSSIARRSSVDIDRWGHLEGERVKVH